ASLTFLPRMTLPGELVEQIASCHATVFAGVPVHYQQLLHEARFSGRHLTRLRAALQAGGPMPVDVTLELKRRFPDCDLHLMYGQTEATARLTCLAPARALLKPSSVGAPLPGVVLTIRTEAGDVVEPGAVGEIYAQGPNVMIGYWG